VRRYDIDLDIMPDSREIRGFVGIAADVVEPVASVVLDMSSSWLAVDSICGPVDDWVLDEDQLTLTFSNPFTVGQSLNLVIWYHGSPLYSSFGIPFFNERDGVPLVATLSEPFGARNWWPCKDQPDDKADTVSLAITVPSNLVVASNGLLLGVDQLPGGRARYRWLEAYPIATYLVSLAITDYVAVTEWYVPQSGDSVPVVHYLYPDLAGNAGAFAVTVPAMGDLSSRFGPYPYPEEKYGHALFPWGGAMEHQTCTSMGEWAAYGGWEWIIVHELAHQWWGDLVTCASFHHVWLNEGFATYGEAIWQEVEGGADAYHAAIAGDEYWGGGTIYVEDPATEDIFDYGLSYQKGAYVLHMLRHVVGDSAFFDGLLDYRDRFAYGSASTDDFTQTMEASAGRDLDWFFEEWIYGAYYPRYEYGWACAPTGGGWMTQLRVEQVQTNTGLFVMPLDVRLALSDGTVEIHPVWIESQVSPTEIITEASVVALELDPDRWVLCRIEEVPLVGDDTPDPACVRLEGPWPNPAVSEASLLAWAPCRSTLAVFDMAGHRRVTMPLEEGLHAVRLGTGDGIAAGAYLVRLAGPCGRVDRPMVIR
jgi:aminopeptidase N